MTKVLIADDQELVRTGFRLMLELEPDIEVVGEASDGIEAVNLATSLLPDVVLMDIRMPLLDGLEATRRLVATARPPRILILTTFDLDEYVYEGMKAGASGFLLKEVPREQLIAGVRMVAAGDALVAPAVTRRLIERFTRMPPPGGSPPELTELTDRELEVMRLVARGLSNPEIAQELIIGDATVKTHVARILQKLDLRDRVQAVVLAYESGLIEAGAHGERLGPA
jgi:DNA-binding NarL/FixJ family response regulator